MFNIKLLPIDLHLFDGAGAGAGAGAGEGTGTASTGTEGTNGTQTVETKPAGSNRRSNKAGDLSNVVYGKQENATDNSANLDAGGEQKKASEVTTTSNTLEEKRKAFEDLINGEYKDIFTERTQGIIDRRFKETKNLEAKLQAQTPILDMLMSKYKISDGDVNKLTKAIEQDDTYWEEAAEEAGLTVEQYKTVQKLERENAELRRAEEYRAGQQRAEQQLNEWYRQGEELKKIYPDFDFRNEVANQNFLGMLKAGLPVQKAYEVMHIDELVNGAAKVAAQKAEQQTVARVREKASRPAENGISSQSASLIKSDVSSLTKADRAEIARRVARGERITF